MKITRVPFAALAAFELIALGAALCICEGCDDNVNVSQRQRLGTESIEWQRLRKRFGDDPISALVDSRMLEAGLGDPMPSDVALDLVGLFVRLDCRREPRVRRMVPIVEDVLQSCSIDDARSIGRLLGHGNDLSARVIKWRLERSATEHTVALMEGMDGELLHRNEVRVVVERWAKRCWSGITGPALTTALRCVHHPEAFIARALKEATLERKGAALAAATDVCRATEFDPRDVIGAIEVVEPENAQRIASWVKRDNMSPYYVAVLDAAPRSRSVCLADFDLSVRVDGEARWARLASMLASTSDADFQLGLLKCAVRDRLTTHGDVAELVALCRNGMRFDLRRRASTVLAMSASESSEALNSLRELVSARSERSRSSTLAGISDLASANNPVVGLLVGDLEDNGNADDVDLAYVLFRLTRVTCWAADCDNRATVLDRISKTAGRSVVAQRTLLWALVAAGCGEKRWEDVKAWQPRDPTIGGRNAASRMKLSVSLECAAGNRVREAWISATWSKFAVDVHDWLASGCLDEIDAQGAALAFECIRKQNVRLFQYIPLNAKVLVAGECARSMKSICFDALQCDDEEIVARACVAARMWCLRVDDDLRKRLIELTLDDRRSIRVAAAAVLLELDASHSKETLIHVVAELGADVAWSIGHGGVDAIRCLTKSGLMDRLPLGDELQVVQDVIDGSRTAIRNRDSSGAMTELELALKELEEHSGLY